jgi:hypothetical protein
MREGAVCARASVGESADAETDALGSAQAWMSSGMRSLAQTSFVRKGSLGMRRCARRTAGEQCRKLQFMRVHLALRLHTGFEFCGIADDGSLALERAETG